MMTNKDEILEELIERLAGCDRAEEVIILYKGIQIAALTAREIIDAGAKLEKAFEYAVGKMLLSVTVNVFDRKSKHLMQEDITKYASDNILGRYRRGIDYLNFVTHQNLHGLM